MTKTLNCALSRLRNSDPARTAPVDASGTDPVAQAMLLRIVDSTDELTAAGPGRRRPHRTRRLVLAGTVTVALLAAAAGAVPMPWSDGQPASAAYAITRNADGNVDVTVHWSDMADFDALNAELRQAGVRAAVMPPSERGRCSARVQVDPAYSGPARLRMSEHPELANSRAAMTAYLQSRTPWIGWQDERDGTSLFTIRPGKIPAGDHLLIVARWDEGASAATEGPLELRSYIVRALPECLPSVEDLPLGSILRGDR